MFYSSDFFIYLFYNLKHWEKIVLPIFPGTLLGGWLWTYSPRPPKARRAVKKEDPVPGRHLLSFPQPDEVPFS